MVDSNSEYKNLSISELKNHYQRCASVILSYCKEVGGFRALIGDHNHWWNINREKGTAKLFYPGDPDYNALTSKYRTLYWTAQLFGSETANVEKPYDFEKHQISEQIGGREDTIYHSFFLDLDKAKDKDIHDPEVIKWLETAIKFFANKFSDAGVKSFGLAFSGGGAYCVLHPRLGMIAEDEKERTYKIEIIQKAFDLFIGDVASKFFEMYPEAIGWVKFDKLNYDKKRQVKTILSIHKKYPYAVIPLDKHNPKIDLKEASLPISDETIEKATKWLDYQDDIENFGNLLHPFLDKAKETINKTHGTRTITLESEEVSEEDWAPCIRNILAKTDLKSGEGASRALSVLASYMRYVGVPEERAFRAFQQKADEWNAETSNIFESWYGCEHLDKPLCFVPSCKKVRTKGSGYPHPELGELGICVQDERCNEIRSPIQYHKKRGEKASKEKKEEKEERAEHYKLYVEKKDGTPKYAGINYKLFADDLIGIHHLKTLRDTGQVICYKNGYYQYNGEAVIKEEAEETFGKDITTHGVNEISGHVQRSTFIDRDSLDADPTLLNLENGLYNIETNEFLPHTPEPVITARVSVKYDPNADCPEIKRFLQDIVKTEEEAILLEEIPGFCLYRRYFIKKAIMLTGGGDNGKSIYFNLIEHLLGKENCSSIVLQKLTLRDRFTNSFLVGMLANIAGDLSADALRDTGMFKMLTGGDYVPAEIKGGRIFKFLNTAKLLFSANEIPGTDDLTSAFWTRWIIINFPYMFVEHPRLENEKQRITEELLLEKLTSPEEMSGFLNLALERLKTLLEKRRFSYDKTTEEIEEEYRMLSSNIYGFVKEWCETGHNKFIPKNDLYNAYTLYCEWKKKFPETKNMLGRELPRIVTVEKIQPKKDGKQVEAWGGISLNENCIAFIENNNGDNGNKGDFYLSGINQKKEKNKQLEEDKEKNALIPLIALMENKPNIPDVTTATKPQEPPKPKSTKGKPTRTVNIDDVEKDGTIKRPKAFDKDSKAEQQTQTYSNMKAAATAIAAAKAKTDANTGARK